MTDLEIEKKVKEIMSKSLEVPVGEIISSSSQKSIQNWDSLAHLKLVMDLENKFNISFKTEEVFSMDSVEEICNTIRKHLK